MQRWTTVYLSDYVIKHSVIIWPHVWDLSTCCKSVKGITHTGNDSAGHLLSDDFLCSYFLSLQFSSSDVLITCFTHAVIHSLFFLYLFP